MTDLSNSPANRAQRRNTSRAKRIGAAGSGAILATSAAAFLAAMGAAPAGAVPITVTNLDDSGAGSLRQALADANEGDVIDLSGLSGTITLTSGELLIEDAVEIVGPGASVLTISGNDTSRVFNAEFENPGGTGTVSISGLTIANGNSSDAGAGLYFECDDGSESLVITGVDFVDNTADGLGGALYFDHCDDVGGVQGDLTVSFSRFTGNTSGNSQGGAIWSDEGDATTIVSSTFAGNTGPGAGAILMDDGESFTVLNSTFVENHAVSGEGDSDGGAIQVDEVHGATLIANSTFVSNTATGDGGAIAARSGTSFTLLQSTVTGNTADGDGDGLYLQMYSEPPASVDAQTGDKADDVQAAEIDGPAVITGTIVSGNADGTDDINGSGDQTVTLTSNVIGVVADTLNVVDGGGNQLGITDPKLAPLSNNGGPTATMGLAPDSPALDAGPATVPDFPGNEFDQRGADFLRVVNGKVDVGAFEVQAPEPIDIAPKFTG